MTEETTIWSETCIHDDWKSCWDKDRYQKCIALMGFKVDAEVMSSKLKAIETWLIEAKAQGRISMSVGFSLDEILKGET